MVNHVICVPRSDSKNHVLLNVIPGSRNDLDIQIEATEGVAPFVASFKHHRLTKTLSKGSSLDDDEWEAIVRHVLLQRRPQNNEERQLLANVEVSAHMDGDQLILAFRKNISGIHQRIADLFIPRDDNHELDTIAWVSTATERSSSLESEIKTLQQERDAQNETVRALETQLEDLVQAKIEHEQDLLEKFSKLLNTKKLKIRNQQKLLESAGKGYDGSSVAPDVSSVPAMDDGDESERELAHRPNITRRNNKRKSSSRAKRDHHDTATEEEDLYTSEETGQETSGNSEDYVASAGAESRLKYGDVSPGSNPAKSGLSSSKPVSKAANAEADNTTRLSDSPPPRRQLPFGEREKRREELSIKNKPSDEVGKDKSDFATATPGNIIANAESDDEL